uniref:hypothetical protein n=1 Tax=Leifsonia sp. TaxID=1870902 RepID=UPI003704912C
MGGDEDLVLLVDGEVVNVGECCGGVDGGLGLLRCCSTAGEEELAEGEERGQVAVVAGFHEPTFCFI